MQHGVAVGKFYPFHKGHEYMLRAGMEQCDQLHILVCQSERWQMDVGYRVRWIRTILGATDEFRVAFRVYIFDQDASGLADHDSPGWAKATREFLADFDVPKIDVVVSSENYGPAYASHLGARSFVVDRARRVVPVSGTMIRENPRKYAHYLDSIVLQDLLLADVLR